MLRVNDVSMTPYHHYQVDNNDMESSKRRSLSTSLIFILQKHVCTMRKEKIAYSAGVFK